MKNCSPPNEPGALLYSPAPAKVHIPDDGSTHDKCDVRFYRSAGSKRLSLTQLYGAKGHFGISFGEEIVIRAIADWPDDGRFATSGASGKKLNPSVDMYQVGTHQPGIASSDKARKKVR